MTEPIRVLRDAKGRVEGADVVAEATNVRDGDEVMTAADADPATGAWEVWGVRIGSRLYSCREFRRTDGHPALEDGPTLDALREAAGR
jgi:hypothetical protein